MFAIAKVEFTAIIVWSERQEPNFFVVILALAIEQNSRKEYNLFLHANLKLPSATDGIENALLFLRPLMHYKLALNIHLITIPDQNWSLIFMVVL